MRPSSGTQWDVRKGGPAQDDSRCSGPSAWLDGGAHYRAGQKARVVFPDDGSRSGEWSLTSFETVLLHCIVAAVLSARVFKKLLVNLCTAALIVKMEENKRHFQCITLYYFKKGRNATETQKKMYAVYGEGAVTECVTVVYEVPGCY